MLHRIALNVMFLLFLAPLALFAVTQAYGQLNNRPYSFPNSADGGVGMSVGGKQAIINEELTGATPDNLVRGNRGQLLDLREGPGNSAIVSVPGGNVIPGFKGSDFRGRFGGAMAAGAFNPFFIGHVSGAIDVSHAYARFASSSGGAIDTWTGRAVNNGMGSIGGAHTVDVWTGLVYMMP